MRLSEAESRGAAPRRVLAAAALGLLVVVCVALYRSSQSPPRHHLHPENDLGGSPGFVANQPPDFLRTAVRSGESETLPTVQPEPSLVIQGTILEDVTGVPLGGISISFGMQGAAPTSAESMPDGTVVVPLYGNEWQLGRVCTVIGTIGREQVYYGSVVLEDNFVLLAGQRARLRGVVVGAPGRSDDWRLVFSVPPTGSVSTALFLARTSLREDFTFEVAPHLKYRPDDVLVTASSNAGSSFAQIVSLTELLSESGASIAVSFFPIVVQVIDDSEDPVEGAVVRAAVTRSATHRAQQAITGADGIARFICQETDEGVVAIHAGKAGYSSATTSLNQAALAAPVDNPTRVRIRVLGPEDTIRGRVRDEVGPIQGAVVSAKQADASSGVLGGPLRPMVRTDEKGEFAMPFRSDGGDVLSVGALGYVLREVSVPVRRDESLDIELVSGSTLILSAQAPRSGAPRPSGPILYALQKLPDSSVEFGHHAGELVVTHRAHGAYRVFVKGPGGEYFGEQVVTVGPNKQRIEVLCVGSTWFSGTVIGADSHEPESLRIRVRHDAWPEEVLQKWTEASVAPDGSFEVFGGNLSDATLVVLKDGRTVAEATVQAGVGTLIDLNR